MTITLTIHPTRTRVRAIVPAMTEEERAALEERINNLLQHSEDPYTVVMREVARVQEGRHA
jgi:hypothetical protein